MNKLKIALVIVFILVGIWGFIYLSESAMVVRLLSILTGFVLAAIVAKFTIQGQEFYVFCKESSEETKKCIPREIPFAHACQFISNRNSYLVAHI